MQQRIAQSPNGRNKQTPIYIGETIVATVDGRTLYKKVNASKHFLQRPRAIGYDVSVLRDAEAAGAICTVVTDRETGTSYSTSIETIWEHGFRVCRGFGEQIALGMAHWSVNGETPEAELRVAQTNKERAELQMSLFAEVGQ